MAAPIIRTADQHTANAGGEHLCEGDLLRAGKGGPLRTVFGSPLLIISRSRSTRLLDGFWLGIIQARYRI